MPSTPSTPSKREWILEPVYNDQGQLLISLEAQVQAKLVALATVICEIGGVVAVSSDREEYERLLHDGNRATEIGTTRVFVRWESFAPARRLPREAPAPEPVPEPEAVPAESEVEAEVPDEAEAVVAAG